MTTRTYCDNCGTTVRNPHKYAFGNRGNFRPAAAIACPQCGYCSHVVGHPGQQHTAGLGQGGAALAAYSPVGQQPASAEEFIIIDLCDRCRPIWMNRVKALTQSSEPDA